MKSETSLVAANVRLNEWARQIQDCKNRPADMDLKTWCSFNGISKANYYYRLRRVREAFLQNTKEDPTTFVELSVTSDSTKIEDDTNQDVIAATLMLNGATLQISDHASAKFLKNLLGALHYVE
ncbi:MAG: IS66 family insertion sequence element accessory protein TnpB [Eubacteriales bacterium]|nr:IS66 family insertion sequence element accessory protein TnpB [Eubacteriales bacterium]